MLDEAHILKKKRLRWVEMVHQLRYGSPVSREVLPGNCQDMLDWLIAREWPFDTPAPMPRHETHSLFLKRLPIKTLFRALPEWAQTERKPKSMEDYPIFYFARGRLIYLDGRRRINTIFRRNPNESVQFWQIEYDINQ